MYMKNSKTKENGRKREEKREKERGKEMHDTMCS
jgi:hypothetical protein